MSEQSQNEIRDAVQQCLARCYQGGTPLGSLAEFLAELRGKGWSQEDIRRVETAARKVLAGILLEDDEP